MCRSLLVMCVAPDEGSLAELRAAAVGAGWELTAGATDERTALDLIDVERPHVLVVRGAFEGLVELVRSRFPSIRIVADRDLPGATVVAASLEEVRGLVLGPTRPRGPVGPRSDPG
jgi:hypothetical protein